MRQYTVCYPSDSLDSCNSCFSLFSIIIRVCECAAPIEDFNECSLKLHVIVDVMWSTVTSPSSSLIVSRTRFPTDGNRALPVGAARVWNSLPDLVTSAPSVAVFRSRLKTHLFNISYPCDCTVPAQWIALDTIIVPACLLTAWLAVGCS